MIEPRGRFAQLLADTVKRKGMSLRVLAGELNYTYEQMRKIIMGNSLPSKLLLQAFIEFLGLDKEEAEMAVAADRMQRTYGKSAYAVLGQDPRYHDIADVVPSLNDEEWRMFVGQIRGYVLQRTHPKAKRAVK